MEVWPFRLDHLLCGQIVRSGLFGPWDALAVDGALRGGSLRVLLCDWFWLGSSVVLWVSNRGMFLGIPALMVRLAICVVV